MPARRESFAVWVLDNKTGSTHEYIIEHVPSDRSFLPRFSVFSRFPASESVLNSLERAIGTMRSITSRASESMLAAITMETESIRLLPLTHHDCDSFTSVEASSPPDEMSLIDTLTSTLAQAVATARNASDSISPRKLANDTIRGCASHTLDPENCIRLFKPVDLPLFDVALLAEAVHDYAPVYGLFDNQCYLFASVLFDAIVQLYSLPASAQDPNIPSSSILSTPVPAPTPEVGAPRNANIVIVPSPDQAGGWAGLLILDPMVKRTVVSIVVSQFKAQRTSYISQVENAIPRAM